MALSGPGANTPGFTPRSRARTRCAADESARSTATKTPAAVRLSGFTDVRSGLMVGSCGFSKYLLSHSAMPAKNPQDVAALVPIFGHESIRNQLLAAYRRGALPASLLLQGPRGIGKQRLAIWLAQIILCDNPAAAPCGDCPPCRFSHRLTPPDLHWFFPRPRPKDGDPDAAEVTADLAEAIADRVAAGGIYAPPAGDEAIYVATVRAIVQSASMSPAIARRKVYVIGDAERMVAQTGADQAANAFLKLLEEPPADTTIILRSEEHT